MLEKKRCTKCGKIKDCTLFNLDYRSETPKPYAACKGCRRIAHQRWRAKNPSKEKAMNKGRYAKNPEKAKVAMTKWRKENVNREKEIQRKSREKRMNTAKGKLNKRMSSGIFKSLTGGSKARRHWESLIDYSIDQLRVHIEKQFLSGMTWNNYGLWHIDHRTPVAAFNFEKPEDIDFRRCWSLKNLRPLWAKHNMSKGAKIDRPFQPSLTIGIEVYEERV